MISAQQSIILECHCCAVSQCSDAGKFSKVHDAQAQSRGAGSQRSEASGKLLSAAAHAPSAKLSKLTVTCSSIVAIAVATATHADVERGSACVACAIDAASPSTNVRPRMPVAAARISAPFGAAHLPVASHARRAAELGSFVKSGSSTTLAVERPMPQPEASPNSGKPPLCQATSLWANSEAFGSRRATMSSPSFGSIVFNTSTSWSVSSVQSPSFHLDRWKSRMPSPGRSSAPTHAAERSVSN
mmetsp:Transcript_94184/g.303102  ORF Transcript_94184/g.303102 Transcript_94184/m.303102 type:complete len:244 (+) Transcript_94184:662-1393(+)